MPFNGAGQFTPSAADNPVITSTLIQSTKFNNTINDVATGLSTCLTKDGQQIATANQPMGGFRHTNVANAANRNEYAAVGQVQDQGFTWVGTFGGTADALTLTPTPAITAYVAGQAFVGKATATNTITTPTVAISGLAVKTLQKDGGALVAGDITTGKWYRFTYDGTNFQLERLQLSGAGASAYFLDGTNFSVKNVADSTKVVQLDVSGIPTSTTVTAKVAAAGVVEGLQGANIASAATINLDTATGDYVHITGSTGPVTAITLAQGRVRKVIWDSTPVLTNGASLILRNGISRTAVANEGSFFVGEAAGVVRELSPITPKQPTRQVFTANGTYTAPSGVISYRVRLVAGGGGSGGCSATAASQAAGSGGGGGGGYSERWLTPAQVGASQTVTVGAGGLAGTAGNNTGGTGGTTSFGALLSATGGVGGVGGTNTTTTLMASGGAGGTGSTGDINTSGQGGSFGVGASASFSGAGGCGGSSLLGGGAASLQTTGTSSGAVGGNYGGGASGAANGQSQSAVAGSAGGPGLVIVDEFYA